MPISTTAITAALAQETEDREICLFKITHSSWDSPLYLSTDATEKVDEDEATGTPIFGTKSTVGSSDGTTQLTYIYVPINPTLPASVDETPPSCKLSIDNVSRYISPYLMTATNTPPKITVYLVMASTPNVIDQQWPDLDLTSITIDAKTVEATMSMDTANTEPCPWLRAVPAYFPNMFD